MSSLVKHFFSLVVLLVPSMALAASHAINPSCGNNGDGSAWSCASSPGGAGAWNAIPASSTLARGDTYYLGDGTYAGGNTFNTAASGGLFNTIKKATSSDYGGMSGWNSSYGDGQAVFNAGIHFSTDNWIFDGVTGGGPGSWASGYGIKIKSMTANGQNISVGGSSKTDLRGANVTVRHIEMQGIGTDTSQFGLGVRYAGNNFTASYIWMYDIGTCPINAPPSYGTSVFEYLFIQSYVPGSLHKEIMTQHIDGIPGNTTIRYSLFIDVQSTGGLMWDNHGNPSAHLYVYGNVFYRPSGATWNYGNGVIAGWTGGGNELFSNVHVYNNTFININGNVFYAYFAAGAYNSTNNEAYNNLFYNSTSPVYTNSTGGNIWKVHDYNYYINSGDSHSEVNGTSAASGDPFVNYINYNFSLSRSTKAGISFPPPFNTDPKGNTRGGGGAWDIGAFEYIGKIPVFPAILVQ